MYKTVGLLFKDPGVAHEKEVLCILKETPLSLFRKLPHSLTGLKLRSYPMKG